MIDSKYSMDIYNSTKVSIETVMKNPELLKFVPDHLQTKKMCKHPVKKLHFQLRYVNDQYKTHQMCNKNVLENGGTLKSTNVW